jgi:hypothetical protein
VQRTYPNDEVLADLAELGYDAGLAVRGSVAWKPWPDQGLRWVANHALCGLRDDTER